MHLTWYEANTWLIEAAGLRILVDPWFEGPLVFGNLPWLFQAERRRPAELPAPPIDAILLSQGLEDHAHPPTLARLDKAIPVIGSPSAARVATALGFSHVTPLAHGQQTRLGQLTLEALPGAPVGPTQVENAYLLQADGLTLYYEPHGFHDAVIQAGRRMDVAITPLVDLSLPLVGPIIRGQDQALRLAQACRPQLLLPTATGDYQASGLIMNLIQMQGSLEELAARLKAEHLSTQILDVTPGRPVAIPLGVPT
ncbi:MAG: MBL fold metallo-hydrolase [Gloeomargaritaceae cyanobacterium C42_A2020_066]|nr:MBL fold metallo-hydrolase [Gloeomargaritaceae cyanobacterium C42_A2020_066]